MLLAIDIGNTNISFGVFSGNKMMRRFAFATKEYNLKRLKTKLGNVGIKKSIICNVVPQAARVLEKDLSRCLGRKPYIIGKDIIAPIKNLYRQPKEVGCDRLVNAYAGVMLYGAPIIIIDFGTAVTFDVVSKKREYLGGMILPGLKISLDALAQRTALLPKIKLGKPKEFIGRDTASSMLSGIVYGFAALTDHLTESIKNKIGRHARVIGTGGNIDLMAKYCKRIDKIDKDLTLKGINLVAQLAI